MDEDIFNLVSAENFELRLKVTQTIEDMSRLRKENRDLISQLNRREPRELACTEFTQALGQLLAVMKEGE